MTAVGAHPEEVELYDKLARRGKLAPSIVGGGGLVGVEYLRQGNFTICRAKCLDKKGRVVELLGVSKRNCWEDPDDVPSRGFIVALSKALRGRAVPLDHSWSHATVDQIRVLVDAVARSAQ